MKIRFLETTPSDAPDYPFQVGQIIEVRRLTAKMHVWLTPRVDGNRLAELVAEEPEAAMVGGGEQAVLKRAKGRTAA